MKTHLFAVFGDEGLSLSNSSFSAKITTFSGKTMCEDQRRARSSQISCFLFKPFWKASLDIRVDSFQCNFNKNTICLHRTYFNLISKFDLDDWLIELWICIMHSSSLRIIYLSSLCTNTLKFLFLLIRIQTNAFGRFFYPEFYPFIHLYCMQGIYISILVHASLGIELVALFELQELNRCESDMPEMK